MPLKIRKSTSNYVDGSAIAEHILADIKKRVSALTRKRKTPHLAVALVGDNKASQTYVGRKKLMAERVGMRFSLYKYPASIGKKRLSSEIMRIQRQKGLSGIIIQLPLPKSLNEKEMLRFVKPMLDVDCLTEENWGKLLYGNPYTLPPTPDATLEILRYHKVDLYGKHVVIVGAGALVGKPLVAMLLQERVTLTVCRSSTNNLAAETKRADIVITAVGKANLITGVGVKKGTIVIDAGVDFPGGKMTGDVHVPSVAKKARLVTPTPGGVGPITVAKLLQNVVHAEEMKTRS